MQFAIADPPPSIRVGLPVTVTVQRGDTVSGMIISRDAIVRGGNGETLVWSHVEPEMFEARQVSPTSPTGFDFCDFRGV